MDFVLVESFTNYIEANIVLGNLESQGINCWLKDENTITTTQQNNLPRKVILTEDRINYYQE